MKQARRCDMYTTMYTSDIIVDELYKLELPAAEVTGPFYNMAPLIHAIIHLFAIVSHRDIYKFQLSNKI